MAFPLPRELNPIEAIRKELKLIEKMKHVHPQFDRDLNRWLVAFVWDDGSLHDLEFFKKAKPSQKTRLLHHPDGIDIYASRWLLAGFTRKPQRWSVKSLRKIRRRLKIPKQATMHVTELWRGVGSIPVEPPRRRVFTTAPIPVQERSLTLYDLGPERKRKFKHSPELTQAFGKKVKFIAFGMRVGSKAPRPTYLGPLMSTKLRAAQHEARQMHRLYPTLTVFELELLPPRWRRKIRSGHYRPGSMLDARITREIADAAHATTALDGIDQ